MQNFLLIFACVLKGFVSGFIFLISVFLCPSYPCSLVLHFCQRNKISSFLGLKTNFSTIRQLLKLILKILCWCSLRVLSKFIKAIIVQVCCRHKHISIGNHMISSTIWNKQARVNFFLRLTKLHEPVGLNTTPLNTTFSKPTIKKQCFLHCFRCLSCFSAAVAKENLLKTPAIVSLENIQIFKIFVATSKAGI